MNTAMSLSDDGYLLCPSCGSDYVHIDDVIVVGRPQQEDGPTTVVTVERTGRVDTGAGQPVPPHGRRHSISPVGWCENCHGRYVFAFVQTKGRTEVVVQQASWGPVQEA